MRNIKLVLEYDGTDFHGWQYQPNLRTVQGDLQDVLTKIFGSEIVVIGAGRTDAGVHARGQVANFKLDHPMPPAKIMAALNGNLARDVRIMAVKEVPLEFHARFDAIRRHYSYTIARQERAINRFYCWTYRSPLDVARMQEASNHLLGDHDFRAFCRMDDPQEGHICCIEKIQWEQFANALILNIVANRFLHHMVRIIVGTMLNVGRGFTTVAEIPGILESHDRNKAGPTVPAKGLCLEKIDYAY
ncbi:MAG: tRNA pseudouridine(38-40) synthase TruA [candidate division KSB1 bacterium]|nr:tRNA pseudouridine(38-40) synthase TruA [candidate division KSB1 bacterium]MDZ7339910.1 tRNA pseudouridine(38-40) synthase TruA [candidate division KSB1 bacterium]